LDSRFKLGRLLKREHFRIARQYRINQQIRAREVRIIGMGTTGTDSIVVPLPDALERARMEGLDLVEVAPNQDPPVCKLLDYGRFKFVQSKKAREAKKSQVRTVQREVRMRPKIGEHDIQAKVKKVRELLAEGAKVKVTVNLRGRENTHPEIAVKVLRRVAEAIATDAKLERPPTVEQRALSIILAPIPRSQQQPTGEPVTAPAENGNENA